MSVPASPFAVLLLGFVLGLRHALDVDHLAAVSTIVSERRSFWSSSLIGALWGLGHTAALLAAAVVVIALHIEIPEELTHLLELGVAAMLVILGANLLRTLWKDGTLHHHVHAHDGVVHVHPHVHRPGEATAHGHPSAIGRKPFFVGLVHGLAGSGALMLAVLATIPSPPLALAYVGVFGAGSVGGMVVMSVLLALPLALTAERFGRAEVALRASAAVASIAIGFAIAWQLGAFRGWV
jgi:hypothetical protein